MHFLELSYNFTGHCYIKINMHSQNSPRFWHFGLKTNIHSEKVIVFGIFGLRPLSLSWAHMFIVFEIS